MSQGVALKELISALNNMLRPDLFRDYAPNGLQVEGRPHVKRIVTGVTASDALIEKAIGLNADAILVHHGYFWKGEDPCLSGFKGKRIKKLMQHDISLIAYHLPLDAHYEVGNNVQLGDKLGLTHVKALKNSVARNIDTNNTLLTLIGETSHNTLESFQAHIQEVLGREPLVIDGAQGREIKKVAWCTGGAQNEFSHAVAAGADVFITGEVSEKNYHEALETGVCFIAAGHHATERYGVQALGNWLKTYFELEALYIDIDNPV
ncbi:MAG TPA: Nif3-like dinuclear metal center hexameric protein [Gammaproteobacteria bacterium]|nr:Nif3-like dinuclear metal center hexameric protein [Chloroflexota bacterium]HBF08739.1 Nif3-like dinuclear metal center hexameric protein [Gammaproteobacteria bacterium]HCK91860.1 Nif3-like dinuclear metal center hexameric protein [Gammaproteobacteria bacterium]|tara:strand:+ start:1516 stop:2304 length:789 start_codon:yes stop_codon:yes gene_type:complete